MAVAHLPTTEDHHIEAGASHLAEHSGEHGAEHSTENRKFAMWLFLASEVIFFSVLIAGYLLVRFAYPEQHSVLNIPLTSLNTFLLLASSFMVVRALAAVESGDKVKFQRSLALTALLGVAFMAIQATEYSALSREGLTISSGPFGAAFFTLTGFHGLHVLIGVLWLLRVFNNAFNDKYTAKDHFGVEFFGLYWHFVDVVWILIFTLVYLI